jgi:soluble lytic murein transglycosylase
MAHLWIGKTQQKLGDQAAARSSWDLAANLDPTGYYSERAYDLINNRQAFSPPQEYDLAYSPDKESAEAEAWLRTTFDISLDVDLGGIGDLQNQPNLVRGIELWTLGLYDDARIEFETLRQAMMNDPVQTYRLANYFAKIGLYRSSTLAARQVLNLAGMDDAATMNAPKLFNRLRFGVHFDDLIIPLAQEYNFHPIFIFSLIRQESLFESFVRSSASARGLMQIMPATGKEIARNLGWPLDYSDADLDRPLVNLRLGLDYLDQQRTSFDGDMYAALAAYNGGPGNALEWQKLAEDDPDLFLEVIRYSETRDYIRRIYEIYNIYRRLYTHTP